MNNTNDVHTPVMEEIQFVLKHNSSGLQEQSLPKNSSPERGAVRVQRQNGGSAHTHSPFTMCVCAYVCVCASVCVCVCVPLTFTSSRTGGVVTPAAQVSTKELHKPKFWVLAGTYT